MPIADDRSTTRPAPPLAALPNLRDAGGLPTRDGGHVRTGLLYRSGQLDRIAGETRAAFAALGVRTVVDLRTGAERDERPDRVPRGTRQLVADVLGDSRGAAPAQLPQLIRNPPRVAQAVRSGIVQQLFERTYRGFVTLPSAKEAYARLYRAIADSRDDELPLLFHCTAGKDRTGWASAALLLLLEVPDTTVLEDFMLSDRLALRGFQPLVDRFVERGGDPDVLHPILGVEPAYLAAGLDELERRHGTVEAWFADALGLGEKLQTRLRERLVAR
ncbi:tyrosine-protein phosphatase [Conexibacter sp. CPCC 206217]|uniref:tyrosine-protein phosphatase n=1 Tax=Conexibacter sp. CPCC 206217 TaxID=3064574 RepID=UPI002718C47E|nr:tyrosine-protein phosphatase [Conexibacter sp. CPCC 206217]MDO8209496.1 tyrosine-protein phosphatase [Conexibacter sp. CPCC 206217]